jgi:hypothetical protein
MIHDKPINVQHKQSTIYNNHDDKVKNKQNNSTTTKFNDETHQNQKNA